MSDQPKPTEQSTAAPASSATPPITEIKPVDAASQPLPITEPKAAAEGTITLSTEPKPAVQEIKADPVAIPAKSEAKPTDVASQSTPAMESKPAAQESTAKPAAAPTKQEAKPAAPVASQPVPTTTPTAETAASSSTPAQAPSSGIADIPKLDLPDIENPYILSSTADRARLVAQSHLFENFLEFNAERLIGKNIKSILDLGCGEGQLSATLSKIYYDAKVVGIDIDEAAIKTAKKLCLANPNLEFVVGDIQEKLPAGEFDLVYVSMVLLHLPNTQKIIELAYKALKPGGYLWTKDIAPEAYNAIPHPLFKRIMELFQPVHIKMGGHPNIVDELPDILSKVGFEPPKIERESYAFGNVGLEGRIVLAVNLTSFYNARKVVSKFNQIPESEIEQIYKDACNMLMAPYAPSGRFVYANIITRRPLEGSNP